tara:strand:- start:8048 stop:8275 length:228 start_codon:yes stop_codon:yes gene_type:complete
VETVLNVGSGAVIGFLLNLYFLPFFVDDIANQIITTAIVVSAVYTFISLVRSFLFRRFFTLVTEKDKVYIRRKRK